MRWLPRDYDIKKPKITHMVVQVAALEESMRRKIAVTKHQDRESLSELDFKKKYPDNYTVDLAYVNGSLVYQDNLDSLKNYASSLYYVINQYISNVSLAKILGQVHGDILTENGWGIFIPNTLHSLTRITNSLHVFITCLEAMLSNPRLPELTKDIRSPKSNPFFHKVRINMVDTENRMLD